MKKLVTFSLLAFIAIGGGVLIVKNIAPNQTVQSGTQNAVTSLGTTTKVTLSIQEVAKHNLVSSCWLIVNNKVYDVTSSINQHPGGAREILSNCGKESTEAFDTKGRPSGKPHSATANSFLDQLYIGDLNQTVNVNSGSTTSNSANQNNQTQQSWSRDNDDGDDEFDD